jgi:casein kinase II subunit beta
MYEKFMNADFGRCPRLACQGQHVLPIGITDNLRICPVNVYCPRCQEAYYTRSTRHAYIDGAYFGTTFAHMFLLHYSELIPKKSGYRYVPKIYGFKINSESPYYTLRLEDGASEASPTNGGNAQSSQKAPSGAANSNADGNNKDASNQDKKGDSFVGGGQPKTAAAAPNTSQKTKNLF